MSTPNFRVDAKPGTDEATLVATTDRLEPSHAVEFQVACLQLLETGRRKLVVNLRGVRSIPSVIVGAVMDAYVMAKGRELILDADVNATNKFIRLIPRLIAEAGPPEAEAGPEEEPQKEEGEGACS